MSNIVDINDKRVEKLKQELEKAYTENKITTESISFHIQTVTNCYLKIFSDVAMGENGLDEAKAILIRNELEKQFCFLFNIIDQEIWGREEL